MPFGGGTSVVGGVEPLRADFAGVVALDLAGLDRLASVDERSLTAVLEAGVTLPEAERLLGERGLTLGHFPQSYEYATVGGCVATRSAGQASTGYGRIDDLVLGVRMAAPLGDVDLRTLPGTAAGPDLRELVVGSEGALGVITSSALRVRARAGGQALRGLDVRVVRRGGRGAPRARAGGRGAGRRAPLRRGGDAAVDGPGRDGRGEGRGGGRVPAGARRRRRLHRDHRLGGHARRRSCAGVRRRRRCSSATAPSPLGRSPGNAWARGRFHGPYLRDHLLDRGVFVETLETATQWSGLERLYRAVGGALRDALGAGGTPPLVMCHVSHLYPSGASLYFTFLARARPGAELEQWRAAKSAATDAIVGAGGTITHHHAVGRDHAPWLAAEVGETGVGVLRAVKAELDPAGIMNPGKLLP